MTREEMAAAIKCYCFGGIKCEECKLRDKRYCYGDSCSDEELEENYNLLFGKPEAERGDKNMEKQILSVGIGNAEDRVITISLERYEELIEKETLYNKITEGKDVAFYLVTREESRNNA